MTLEILNTVFAQLDVYRRLYLEATTPEDRQYYVRKMLALIKTLKEDLSQ